ncbi:hypothetical protein L208DRAFT_1312726 [Tricholoma matsutake]|nr:hypothetical protein L208DRAFT_1312726 [Tricholoma matsutake 945]
MIPTTLEGMINTASKYDGQWRRAKAITGRLQEALTKKLPSSRAKETPLEINRLSYQERIKHMKKGLCFVCHQPGHRATEHKKGEKRTEDWPPPKNKGREAYLKIRAIIGELDEGEKKGALAAIEDEATLKNQSMCLDIKVLGAGRGKAIETEALLDSGAGGIFMSHEFAESSGFGLHPLEKVIKVRNVDGTPNKKGDMPGNS